MNDGPEGHVRLFLCGDVMLGRGIDQILPSPGDPGLHERFVGDARDYVALAEAANGRIPRQVPWTYPWGDALPLLAHFAPDARIVNLETAITTSGDALPKGINYRMHPGNLPCLLALNADCCVLANNHVLDWGKAGLIETLQVLHSAQITTAGAGLDARQAASPAILNRNGIRILVIGLAAEDSGVPPGWAASTGQPGVNFTDFSAKSIRRIAKCCRAIKRPGDLVVVSIHWGANWGYEISAEHRVFARSLIDQAGVDIIHGHSSHHAKAFEIYCGKPVLYGCGDFLNDYEGIGGYERFRDDLSLLYFLTVDRRTTSLIDLTLVPMRKVRFRLQHADSADRRWLEAMLNSQGKALGTRVSLSNDGPLKWVLG